MADELLEAGGEHGEARTVRRRLDTRASAVWALVWLAIFAAEAASRDADPLEALWYPVASVERVAERHRSLAEHCATNETSAIDACALIADAPEDALALAIEMERELRDFCAGRTQPCAPAPDPERLSRLAAGSSAPAARPGDAERWRAYAALNLTSTALMALGLVAFGLPAARRGSALGAPPWSAADAFGVWVRGEVALSAYYAVLSAAAGLEPALVESPGYDVLWHGGPLLGALPMLWLAERHLLGPARAAGARDPLGLQPVVGRWPALAAIALAAIGVDLLGSWGAEWAVQALGRTAHWTEGYDETLAFGDAWRAALAATSYIALAPPIEEFAYRGLIYFGLRRQLGPVAAACASAGLFTAVHFYSLAGSLATFWSGLVWAFAFERARSLWPGVAAHALYNALYVAGALLLTR